MTHLNGNWPDTKHVLVLLPLAENLCRGRTRQHDHLIQHACDLFRALRFHCGGCCSRSGTFKCSEPGARIDSRAFQGLAFTLLHSRKPKAPLTTLILGETKTQGTNQKQETQGSKPGRLTSKADVPGKQVNGTRPKKATATVAEAPCAVSSVRLGYDEAKRLGSHEHQI